jgi:hypothetical protein
MDDKRSWRRAVARLAIGGLAGALLMVLGLAPSAMAAPVSHLRINNASVTEGDAGIANLTFSISYTGAKNDISVDWATADGSATAGADYTSASGTASFSVAGAKSQTITIGVDADLLDEANETLTVTLSNPQPPAIADITTPTGTGTIRDNDQTPSLAIDDVSIAEGDAGTTDAGFTVALSAPSGRAVKVHYATANGTAVQPADYTATSGDLTFAPGQVALSVSVPVTGDSAYESDESFFVNLSSASNATIADKRGVGTIVNDDPLPSVVIADVSRIEGNAGAANLTFTVTLSTVSSSKVTVAYATSDGTGAAPLDYTARSGTVTFSAGQTSKAINVPVRGDKLDEDDETFTVILSSPTNAVIADGEGVGTIVDDDATPSISIGDVSVAELTAGAVPATFAVTMSAVSGRTVTVDYATSDVTATAPGDYSTTSGTLTFDPGQTVKTIVVDVQGDALNEATETYHVTLSNPVGVTITRATGTGTIADDDPVPGLGVADLSVAEGDVATTVASITVSLASPSGLPVTVDYVTAEGSADASDFVGVSGTLSFLPGELTKSVDVEISGDRTYETDEVFSFTLSNPANALLTGAAATVTIVNDDLVPQVTIDDADAIEGDAGTTAATFTVSLSNPSALPVTVDHATVDATATSPADYVPAGGTLTFAPGETSHAVDVQVLGDTTYEQDETFTVHLSNASGSAIADAEGVGTISNDDVAPGLGVSAVSVPEGDAGDTVAAFTVTLDAPSELPVSVDAVTADGSAVQPSDYEPVSTSVTFAPGQVTETVDVTVHGDTVVEPDETFTLQLSNATDAIIGVDTGNGTIVNDDIAAPAPPVQPTASLGDASALEGEPGSTTALTFPVTLSDVSSDGVTIVYRTVAGSATEGIDYEGLTGSVRIPAGQVAASIQVTVIGDGRVEADETFSLEITDVFSARPGPAATGTIANDDLAGTSITLRATGRHRHILARGRIVHAEPGMRVQVVLLKELGGDLVKVARDTVRIRIRNRDGVRTGTFRARFAHVPAGRYLVRSVFRGDPSHAPARAHVRVRL